MTTVGNLFESRKFLVALLATIAAVVLAAVGKLDGAEALKFIERVTMVWLGAHALQEGLTAARK